jgi:hypothetical protein
MSLTGPPGGYPTDACAAREFRCRDKIQRHIVTLNGVHFLHFVYFLHSLKHG